MNNALETLSSVPCFHSKSAVSRARERSFLGSRTLGVNKGHCNVAGSFGGWETFMVVGQASRMHEGPPFPWSSNGAVVAQEPAASSLVVDANSVQGDVDGEGGRVVVGHEGWLLVRFVANHKGQFKLGLGVVSWVEFLCDGCNIVQKKLIPFSFKANLVHVYVNSWDILISSLYSAVRVVTCGPLAIMFHFFHQIITGSVSEYGEPVNIWAGLQTGENSRNKDRCLRQKK